MMNEQEEGFQEVYTLGRKATGVKKAGSLAYQEARARANMYRFLSAIFLNPPQQSFLEQIADKNYLKELSMLFGEKVVSGLKEFTATAPLDKELASLKQEYMDLFAVPTGHYVTPFEDVYRGMAVDGKQERGPLLGKRAIAVIRIYREAGAEMDGECKELPTHIGVELSFMSFLCEREAWTIRMEETGSLVNQEKTKTMDSNRYRLLQLKFLQAHLNGWFPQLNQSIQANAKNPFYRSLALITEAFLAQDTASLLGQPDSERHMVCRPKEPQ